MVNKVDASFDLDQNTARALYVRWVAMHTFQRNVAEVFEYAVTSPDDTISPMSTAHRISSYITNIRESEMFQRLMSVHTHPVQESLPRSMQSLTVPTLFKSRIQLNLSTPTLAPVKTSKDANNPVVSLSDGKSGFCVHHFSTRGCTKTAQLCKYSHTEPANEGHRTVLKGLYVKGKLVLKPKYTH